MKRHNMRLLVAVPVILVLGLLAMSGCSTKRGAKDLKVAAAAAEIQADDSMALAGGIHARYGKGEDAPLRASAVIVDGNIRVCMVACDVLTLQRDVLDEASREIEKEFGIPFDNILITATHTHSAPATNRVHGVPANEVFCQHVQEAIVSSVRSASERFGEGGGAECYFALGHESSVGRNSRLLLEDGTILWVPLTEEYAFNRPTGPFDPQLPVIAFKRPGGKVEALIFNHSTHNIGGRGGGRSPSFYGLAAQEIEDEFGGTVLFVPGAFGSTHAFRELPTDERVFRISRAIEETFAKAEKREISRIQSVKKEFEFTVREFDEEKEDKAVSYYCKKMHGDNAESVIEVFRKQREELAPHQGEVRKTWLHVVLVGDIAFVGMPGEVFTKLGVDLKRRSPFRYTYIIGLANDYIGYIPDDEAYDLGGYQVWSGLHSYVARGTGEAMVDEAVRILEKLYEGGKV